MLRRKLNEGTPQLGTLLSIPSPEIVELLGLSDFDFVILDMEHGEIDLPSLPHLLRAADSRDLPVVVRVPEIRREPVLKSLDRGAEGIMVPQVETADQARQIVQYAKYAPTGSRGVIVPRAGGYGEDELREYLQAANETTLLVVQCETARALGNLDELAGVEGVDVISVGPLDLSVSLDVAGAVEHEKMEEATERVARVAQDTGLSGGISVSGPDQLERRLEQGYHFLIYSMDTMLFRRVFKRIRSRFEDLR